MTSPYISLGWYVRFVPLDAMEAMDRFYADVLGLPRLWHSRIAHGKVENKDLYWAGEAIVENHNCGAPPDVRVGPRESDPVTARQMPFYRVSELDAIVSALRGKGVTVIGPTPCRHGREACVLDPMNMLLGLRQIDAESPLPQDVEAARRRLRGEAFNPGSKPMPAGWQELGWVRIRAADPEALAKFYADTLGFARIDAGGPAAFDLGDNTILEIESGGVARPPPPMQMSSLAAVIQRVDDALKLRAALKAAGVHFVHDLIVHAKGNLCYVADPEGNVLGFSDRLHPGAYVEPLPTELPPVSLEDVEAQRRWVESRQPGRGR